MHGPVRNQLEELLKRGSLEAGRSSALVHLNACDECSSELETMKSQSALFANLRAGEEIDPTAGFYGRVMQRIEERAKTSIWSVFVDSPFGNRLALASLSLALAVGTYVVTQESLERHFTSVAEGSHYDVPVTGSQAQQRDAVLMNFATHLQAVSAQEGTVQ